MDHDTISLILGKAEALILFELLVDFHSQSTLQVKDNAEKLALVRLHGALEKTLVEPFSVEYTQILTRARAHLIRQWGNAG
jgi:hypothetical protein